MTEQEIQELRGKVKKDSVVQVNQNGNPEWIACFVLVTEVKPWGIQGYCKIPSIEDNNAAFIRLQWDEMEYIGEAVIVVKSINK